MLDFIERMDITRLKISTQDYDDLFGSGHGINGLLSQPRLANEDKLTKENQTIKESFYGGIPKTTGSPNMNVSDDNSNKNNTNSHDKSFNNQIP